MIRKIKRKILSGVLLLSILSVSACAEDSSKKPQESTGERVTTAEADTSPVEIPTPESGLRDLQATLEALPETAGTLFVAEEKNGTVIVTEYRGTDSRVRVPERLAGMPVSGIAATAFSGNTELEMLFLPDGISSIEAGALVGCTGLRALHTPIFSSDRQSGQFLGVMFGSSDYRDNARDVPPSLKLLSLGEGAEALPEYALFDCNDLEYLILPETVKKIGKFALYECESFLWVEGLEHVTEYGEYAFALCKSLERLPFGDGTVSMGFGMLFGCSGISVLTLPFVGAGDGEHGYLAYLFGAEAPEFSKGYYPASLARVELLPSCRALENNAFYECVSLKEVVLPEGLSSIGVRAFAGCTSLWQVSLPASLRKISEMAFSGCTALRTVNFSEGLESMGIAAFSGCVSLSAIALPESLEALPASAFANCSSLSRVSLGGVRRIGKNAFYACFRVSEVSGREGIEEEQ